MSSVGPGATPLFIDTSAFFARFNEGDTGTRHDRATATFTAIREGDLPFRPLYTSGYVLAELATLMLRKSTHADAMTAIERIEGSPNITVLHPDAATFAAARHAFARYDDQQISFIDHMTGVLAAKHDIDHIFAFDSDFRTLGFTLVPEGMGEA
jgi:predicted nucleic acid-binding protein